MKRIVLIVLMSLLFVSGRSQLAFTVSSSSGSYSLTCQTPFFTLLASSNFSAPVTFTFLTPTLQSFQTNSLLIANTPGIYTITANSGTSSATQTLMVIKDKTPPSISLVSDSLPTLSCKSNSILLTAIPNPGNALLTWTVPSVGLAPTTTYVAHVPGTYAVQAMNTVNGCAATASLLVSANYIYPSLNPAQVFTLACPLGSVMLQAPLTQSYSALTYTWTSPVGNQQGSLNSANLSTSGTGIFTVSVTHSETGCISTAQVYVYGCVDIPKYSGGTMSLKPNPFSTSITWKNASKTAQKSYFNLYDLSGHELQTYVCEEQELELQLSELPSGLYYLKVHADSETMVFRLVKIP